MQRAIGENGPEPPGSRPEPTPPPPAPNESVARDQAEFGRLWKALSLLSARLSGRLDEANKRISSLERHQRWNEAHVDRLVRVFASKREPPPLGPVPLEQLPHQVFELQSKVEALTASVASLSKQLSAVTERLAKIERRLDSDREYHAEQMERQ